mmetsp:Transcript_10916/g.25320  ORF Transcript_10916/g.25320 Transcript_10916/m.25320 type:complete len:211 (-) Transcript_10916:228-860(-)
MPAGPLAALAGRVAQQKLHLPQQQAGHGVGVCFWMVRARLEAGPRVRWQHALDEHAKRRPGAAAKGVHGLRVDQPPSEHRAVHVQGAQVAREVMPHEEGLRVQRRRDALLQRGKRHHHLLLLGQYQLRVWQPSDRELVVPLRLARCPARVDGRGIDERRDKDALLRLTPCTEVDAQHCRPDRHLDAVLPSLNHLDVDRDQAERRRRWQCC